jgi:hypothetical protein
MAAGIKHGHRGLALSLAAVAVIGGFTGWLLRGRHDVGYDPRDRDRLEALEARVEQLQATQQMEPTRPTAPPSPPAVVAASASVRPPSPPIQEVATRPEKRTSEQRQVDLEARFYSQERDASWSTGARAQIDKAVSTIPHDGTTVTGVECRESMCRVAASHQDLSSFQYFADRVLGGYDLRWTGPTFATVTRAGADGKVETVAYLGRSKDSLALDDD